MSTHPLFDGGVIPGYDPWATAGDDFIFEEELAERVIEFYETRLRHIEGRVAGQLFKLEPWQKAWVGNLFGWVHRDTGLRRYRESLLYVPRKNGKTPLVAGLILFMLKYDGKPTPWPDWERIEKEAGVQAYSGAADREQASLLWTWATGFLKRDDALRPGFRSLRSTKTIEHTDGVDTAEFKALSSDADTKHGKNSHLVAAEELHAHKGPDLFNTLSTSTASREQPLLVSLTTADTVGESVCNEKYDYACKVRDGVIEDDAFLPCIYEAMIDDDWTDPEVWAKANPNLGVSVSEEYLRREMKRAQEQPSAINDILRLHLNVRTAAEKAWFAPGDWEKGMREGLAGELVGEPCFGGLDLSKTVDLTSFALWFPTRKAVLIWYWIPRETALKAERRDHVPYLAWERQGHIRFTEGNVVDYGAIRDELVGELDENGEPKTLGILRTYAPACVGYDPWNATQFSQEMTDLGVRMVEVRQGYKTMSEPSKELERLVVGLEHQHEGNPVSAFCAANVMLARDPAGNIKPDKDKSRQKIDGIVAEIVAISAATYSGEHVIGADYELVTT